MTRFKKIFNRFQNYRSKHEIYICFNNIICFIQISSAQEQFRVDYDHFSICYKGEALKLEEGNNTFVFNINKNGDIAHYKKSGRKEVYKKISIKEEGYTPKGKHYQLIAVLNEKGYEIFIRYFDDKKDGLQLIATQDSSVLFFDLE